MTASNQPKTRVQQLIEKAMDPAYPALDAAEELLDRQAGFYSELLKVRSPEDALELLADISALLKEQGHDLKENFLYPTLAAVLHISSRNMEILKLPEERAGEVLSKVGGIFGITPELFTGAPAATLAQIMERDLDIPGFETELKRFGFTVKDGAIGGPAPAAAKPNPAGPKP